MAEHSRLYSWYLGSRLWRLRRLVWWVSSNGRCQRCRRPVALHGPNAAQVHHRTYRRLGHERRRDVELLCWRCHPIADRERRAWIAAQLLRSGVV